MVPQAVPLRGITAKLPALVPIMDGNPERVRNKTRSLGEIPLCGFCVRWVDLLKKAEFAAELHSADDQPACAHR
jgi:hypothetical protein